MTSLRRALEDIRSQQGSLTPRGVVAASSAVAVPDGAVPTGAVPVVTSRDAAAP